MQYLVCTYTISWMCSARESVNYFMLLQFLSSCISRDGFQQSRESAALCDVLLVSFSTSEKVREQRERICGLPRQVVHKSQNKQENWKKYNIADNIHHQ